MLSNVVLNYILIGKYGAIGVLMATLFVSYISTFISLIIINHKIQLVSNKVFFYKGKTK